MIKKTILLIVCTMALSACAQSKAPRAPKAPKAPKVSKAPYRAPIGTAQNKIFLKKGPRRKAVLLAKTKTKTQTQAKAKKQKSKMVQKKSTSSPKKTRALKNKSTKWIWPVKGKLVNRFSAQTKGIQIQAKKGTSVKAAQKGVVIYCGDALKGYHNLIILKHANSYLTAYAQNDAILVKEKQTVEKGQTIARTGYSSAGTPMLHFEIRYSGKPIDPLKFLPR